MGPETKKENENWLDHLKEETVDALNSLKNMIFSGDKGVTKEPTMDNGAVVFNYENTGGKYEIVTRKENGVYKVRIKKWGKLQNGKMGWQTQKNGNNETFNFNANNRNNFNIGLGSALNKVIGNCRDKLPNTGGRVYDLLNTGNTTVKRKQESVETKGMPRGLALDHGTYVYTVQSGDNESLIKRKLSGYAPLSYLKNVPDGINGWNLGTIPDKKLLPGLKIPVPKQNSEKIKTISKFKDSQKSAINEMKNNATYGNYIKKLIREFGENHIANVMTAYAKSETCPTDYDDKVGKFALFRYEKSHQCASYGYHHVLWEGHGKKAFSNTGLSIGQACSPKESGKLFLAFCIEKVNGSQKKENRGYENFKKFFNMKNTDWCAKRYNGGEPGYSNKLKKNFEKVENS